MTQLIKFPGDFLWGAATASYQIEGGAHADGKGESIWDAFSHTPGKVLNGDTGDVACDHYHRWRDDIQLMQSLGLKSYRFSLSWPRIFPDGVGKFNQAGLDFYSQLVDALLEANIEPLATLFHWDLPTGLKQGWLNRSVVDAFTEYSGTMIRNLGDRVKTWFTINEPYCAAHLGYSFGIHAPGMRDLSKGLVAAHHLLLAHGSAVKEVRAAWNDARVGIVLNLSPIYNDPDSPVSDSALRHSDGESNRWFLDSVFGKGYPKDMLDDFVRIGVLPSTEPDFILPGDMDTIAQETDLLGINYYTRFVASAPKKPTTDQFKSERKPFPPELSTEMGWELYPFGLYEILKRVHDEYHPKQIIVAENGASYSDGPGPDGKVHDFRRINYLQTHLNAVHQAILAGVPVSGYLVWSLMDNFEWSFGYSQRFGLIFIDFETQQRIPKDSAHWFSKVMKQNALELTE